jgi:hypothetical protein
MPGKPSATRQTMDILAKENVIQLHFETLWGAAWIVCKKGEHF